METGGIPDVFDHPPESDQPRCGERMNLDELFTRCPTCKTVFRTHQEQLSMKLYLKYKE